MLMAVFRDNPKVLEIIMEKVNALQKSWRPPIQ
jgi:hypothetical protein